MATDRSFSQMLNEHLSYELLKQELLKRMWLLENIDRDDKWKGGQIIVPFKGTQASSVKWGGLTTDSDIGESAYTRGTISSYKECWGSLKLQHTDIFQHDGKINEASFINAVAEETESFMDVMKTKANLNMLNGFAAKATADGDASGNITVAHPERFYLKEKVFVDDDNSSVTAAGYIQSINYETGVIQMDTTRAGGTPLNLGSYTVAQNAKLYYDGTEPGTDNGFTSLRSQLLSSANGGASTIFGATKTASPFTQAINASGSTFTEDNFLEGLFNKWVTIRNRASGRPTKAVMSFQNLAAAMKNLEVRGQYRADEKSRKASAYGWESIDVMGPAGGLTLVGVQEMEDDVVMILDPKKIRFHSNGFFQRRKGPDGLEWYTVRGTSGYYYILDHILMGELAAFSPCSHGIIHSINFSLSEA